MMNNSACFQLLRCLLEQQSKELLRLGGGGGMSCSKGFVVFVRRAKFRFYACKVRDPRGGRARADSMGRLDLHTDSLHE